MENDTTALNQRKRPNGEEQEKEQEQKRGEGAKQASDDGAECSRGETARTALLTYGPSEQLGSRKFQLVCIHAPTGSDLRDDA